MWNVFVFCLVFFWPPRIIVAELGRSVKMVSEVGCWFSNPWVYFQKQLQLLRQKYFFCKIYWFTYILKLCCARVFLHRWNSFVCNYIQTSVSSFVFTFVSLLPFDATSTTLGDARSGRSGMSRSIWFQHEQSNAWRPTVKQRSPPFPIQRTIWKDQISNPSSLRYIIKIF